MFTLVFSAAELILKLNPFKGNSLYSELTIYAPQRQDAYMSFLIRYIYERYICIPNKFVIVLV